MYRNLRIIFLVIIIGFITTFISYLCVWRKPIDEYRVFKSRLFNPKIDSKLKQEYEYMGREYSCMLTVDVYTSKASSGLLTFRLSQVKHFPLKTINSPSVTPVIKKKSCPLSLVDLTKCLTRDGYLTQWEATVDTPGPLRLKIWRKTGEEWEVITESRVENAKAGLNRFRLDPPLNVHKGDYLGFYTAWNPGLFPVKIANTRGPSKKVYVPGDFYGKVQETKMIRDAEGSYDFKVLYSLFDTRNQESVSVPTTPGRALYRLKLPSNINLSDVELSIEASKGSLVFIVPDPKNILTGIGLYIKVNYVPSAVKAHAHLLTIDKKEIPKHTGFSIYEAIHDCDIRAVRQVLDARPDDISLINAQGLSPLAQACEEGCLKIVELLLKEDGPDINETDASGNTPLHFASGKGHDDIIKLLISQKAAVNAVNCHGDTPLFWAVNNNHISSAKLLIEHGAEVNQKNEYGWSPLHLSAYKGYQEMTGLLIDKGSEVNARDNQGVTAIFWAVDSLSNEVVELLLRKGATVDLADNQGWTPLHWAVNVASSAESKKIVRSLIDKGANVQVKDKFGQTPLFWVRNENCSDIVGLLVNKGADVNATNKWGFSVLDWAAENGDGELVEALVSRGANVSKLDPSRGIK